MHCPNLLIHKVATLVPPPRPVKPVHPPIADIIRVCLLALHATLIHGTKCDIRYDGFTGQVGMM